MRLLRRTKEALVWFWLKVWDEIWTIAISLFIGGLTVAGTARVVEKITTPPSNPEAREPVYLLHVRGCREYGPDVVCFFAKEIP